MIHQPGHHLPGAARLPDVDGLHVQLLGVRVPPHLDDGAHADIQPRHVHGRVRRRLLLLRHRRRRRAALPPRGPSALAPSSAALLTSTGGRGLALDLMLGKQNVSHAHCGAGCEVRPPLQLPEGHGRRAELLEDGVGGVGNEGRQEVCGDVHRLQGGADDHRLALRRAVAFHGPRCRLGEVLISVLHGIDGELARALHLQTLHSALRLHPQRSNVEDLLRGAGGHHALAVLVA
mmetsp:Transcript_27877/g.68546  ORF Transcript_27877/g.68546 Transcript_27877/m.68546 type:complete len:233 (+) Transcript_27877:435-1133(+)